MNATEQGKKRLKELRDAGAHLYDNPQKLLADAAEAFFQ
jgi:hypothetical protein